MGIFDPILDAADQAAGYVQAPFKWAFNDVKDLYTGEGPYKDIRMATQNAMSPIPVSGTEATRTIPASGPGGPGPVSPTTTTPGVGSAVVNGKIDWGKLQPILSGIAAQYGVDPAPYFQSVEIERQLAEATGAEPPKYDEFAKNFVTQIRQDAQAQRQQAYTDRAQYQQTASDQQFALALQAQTAQYFQPFIQNILQSGETSAAALNSLASTAPPGFEGVFKAQAQQQLAGAQRLAGAYGAQAMLSPTTYYAGIAAQTQQSALDNAYKQAQIAQAQAMANYYNTGTENFGGIGGGSSGSGGSESIEDIAAKAKAAAGT